MLFFDGEHDVFYSVLWCTATTFYYMNFCKCRRIKIHSNKFCLSGDLYRHFGTEENISPNEL